MSETKTPPLNTHQPRHLRQEHRGQRGPRLTKAELNLRSQEKCVLDFKASPGVAFTVIREELRAVLLIWALVIVLFPASVQARPEENCPVTPERQGLK